MTTHTNEDDFFKSMMSFLLLTLLFTFSHLLWAVSVLAAPVREDIHRRLMYHGQEEEEEEGRHYSFLEETLFVIIVILLQLPFQCIPVLCYTSYSKTEIFISKALLRINHYFGPYIVTLLVYLCIEPILDLVVSAGDNNPKAELRTKIVPGLFTIIVSGVALVAVREDFLVVARFFMALSLMASLYLVRKDASFSAVAAALFPAFLALFLTNTMLIPAEGLSRRLNMIMQDREEKKQRKNLHENKVRKEAPKREKIKKSEKLLEEV